MSSKFPQRVKERCEGIYQSSLTIETFFDRYSRYTGSRKFYRLCRDMLDENIERLAQITEACEARGFSPSHQPVIANALTMAQSKSWDALEKVTKHAFQAFGEDLWTRT